MKTLFGIVLAAVLGATVMAAPAMAVSGTVVTNVSPVTASGSLRDGYHVVERHSGADCMPDASDFIRGADRCFAGNYVYDPCFSSFRNGVWTGVYCVYTPWRHAVTRLTGHEDAPLGPHESGRSMWGLRTNSGRHCTFDGGMTATYHQRRLNFACNANRWLVGYPNEQGAYWHIIMVTWAGSQVSAAHRIAIQHAYFALVYPRP